MTPLETPSALAPLTAPSTDDLDELLAAMPERVSLAIAADRHCGELIEVVLDLGRLPEARYPERVEELGALAVTREDLAFVVGKIGRFGRDNRAGIERTLHRFSALRNRAGDIIGLTCRVGRAIFGTLDLVRDVIETGQSILLLGRPGVGKTTLLREAARVLAGDLGKRVVIVDTSNEIAGDGDIPHPGIGRARRMQVPAPEDQHRLMIEAVENHMPEVIVIDEIGSGAEALAARTIAERGVQLIATAHGNTLENLLHNPTLSDLVGGIQAVTLSDEEARRRGTQKTVLERRAAPTFPMLIEIQTKDRLAVYGRVAEVIDRYLRGYLLSGEIRRRTEEGVEIDKPDPLSAAVSFSSDPLLETSDQTAEDTHRPLSPEPPQLSPWGRRKRLRIFPYAISRNKLERAIRDLRVPAVQVSQLRDADVFLTTKSQERRQPRRLHDAELRGLRFVTVKSNTVKQLEHFLCLEFDLEDGLQADSEAMQEVQMAIDAVLDSGKAIELSPQIRPLRRLQHEQVTNAGLVSESRGIEPNRRLVISTG